MTLFPPGSARVHTVSTASVMGGALCLSVSAILVKLAGVDAATTAMLRCALAVLVLVPLAIGEQRRRGCLSRPGIGWAAIAGVALGIDYAAWTAAIYQVGAGISTVLINVQVIVLPLLALFIDREPIARRFLRALPLMLLGMSFVGGIWDVAALGMRTVTGTLLGLLAGLSYGAYLFLTRRAALDEPGRVIQPLTWATASAAVTTALLATFTGGPRLTGIGVRSWMLLIVLAVLGQVVAWLLVHHGSARLVPSTTAALLLVQPVLALALSAAVLSEHPTRLQILGAIIVIAAVAVANGLFRRRTEIQPGRTKSQPVHTDDAGITRFRDSTGPSPRRGDGPF
ncbi:DMT family transporter [Brevibacterium sp.]|uniref:DMT family transporter n=1 Tax=Brevibacterium sp. TaxID=1701 RepID=UPI0025BA2C16|nr:DMT family transporter [Brevibacterium sp.]